MVKEASKGTENSGSGLVKILIPVAMRDKERA